MVKVKHILTANSLEMVTGGQLVGCNLVHLKMSLWYQYGLNGHFCNEMTTTKMFLYRDVSIFLESNITYKLCIIHIN